VPLSALQHDARKARRAAEAALASALSATGATLDGDRRCERPEMNLVPTITPERWAAIAGQLGGGNGGELRATGKNRPKFCSAFSSCALAVNTFGPFYATRTLPPLLPSGAVHSGDVIFEAQRTAGVRGYKPNLDAVAEPLEGDWLFVESKCLEYLRPHTTAFSDAFVGKAAALLAPETADEYAAFAAMKRVEQQDQQLLDAAQLLKHYLAAKVASSGQRRVELAYVFWEPSDAAEHPVFAAHRQEAIKLASTLVDEHVRLVPISYGQLWSHWEQLGDAELVAHVGALRTRYDVALGASG
jgi:hypothetical protein